MVRISDILKHKGQFPEPEPPKRKKEEKPTYPPSPEETPKEAKATEEIQIAKAMAGEESETEKEMEVARAMHQMQLDPEESRRIYNRALEVITDILDKAESDAPIDLKEAEEIVKIIVDRIVLGDKELFLLSTNYSEDNYLYTHSVNVCILTIDVGLGLGYNKSKLNELGLGAFLCGVGMMKVIGVANQPRALTEREYAQIKKHPIYSTEILKRMKDIEEAVVYIAKQEHERLNGTGYPEGLKEEEIHEYAKVVAVVDVYEALTHPRPHRKAMVPHEAIKELLSIDGSRRLFKMSIIKVLINRIGLYPVGSWIELNTGEIAKVASSNENLPLRPKVNIIFSPDKEKLPQMKPIDLFRHTNVFIKRPVNPQDLNLKLD